jgi:hypothetical protein
MRLKKLLCIKEDNITHVLPAYVRAEFLFDTMELDRLTRVIGGIRSGDDITHISMIPLLEENLEIEKKSLTCYFRFLTSEDSEYIHSQRFGSEEEAFVWLNSHY